MRQPLQLVEHRHVARHKDGDELIAQVAVQGRLQVLREDGEVHSHDLAERSHVRGLVPDVVDEGPVDGCHLVQRRRQLLVHVGDQLVHALVDHGAELVSRRLLVDVLAVLEVDLGAHTLGKLQRLVVRPVGRVDEHTDVDVVLCLRGLCGDAVAQLVGKHPVRCALCISPPFYEGASIIRLT